MNTVKNILLVQQRNKAGEEHQGRVVLGSDRTLFCVFIQFFGWWEHGIPGRKPKFFDQRKRRRIVRMQHRVPLEKMFALFCRLPKQAKSEG